MADTSYIQNEVEPYVRGWLSSLLFPGRQFSTQSLQLSSGAFHKFGAVSQDKVIVAEIKGHSWKKRNSKPPTEKYAQLYQALYFLSLVTATQKFLVVTNEEMYRDFKRRSEGRVAEGIRILLCPLPPGVSRTVKNLQAISSREQS
ncbi:MAG: hypothetical protein HY671_00320 [Chloroflexi bacterium]|nr:hypothetical protein [Chloroflexota bacterium]